MTNMMVVLRPSSLSFPLSQPFPFTSPLPVKPHPLFLSPKPHHPLLSFANNDLREQGKTQQEEPPNEQDEKANDWSKQRRPILGFNFNWSTLLDPDPDNVLALGLTGILTWASVQVLWQLLFISFAILVAALKYSFIAALLLFILIALL